MKRFGVTPIALVAVLVALPALSWADPANKVPITTTSQEARELFLKGRDLQEKLRAQESRPLLEKAITKDPQFAMAYLFRAFAQPAAISLFEDLKKAVSLAEKVSDGERLWILGADAGANGLPMKQREYYQQLVATYPDDERAHNLLGNNYFAQQEYAKANAEYEKAIAINPDFSQPYNQLGYSHRFSGNFEEAKKAFKQYIKVIPDDPNPYDSYAELLMRMGEFEESIENYRKALSINANFVPSFIGIATNLNFLGRHQEAREELEKMYKAAADDGQRRGALLAKAISYVDEGAPEKALDALEERYSLAEKIQDAPSMAGDLNIMGNVLLEIGRADDAVKKFDESLRLIEASDQSADAKANATRANLFNTARAALKKKDLKTAKVKSEEFRAKAEGAENPGQIRQAHELAGMIALDEAEYEEAITHLKQANPLNPYNVFRLARAYEGKGDADEAGKLYERALKFNSLNNLNYAFLRARAHKSRPTSE